MRITGLLFALSILFLVGCSKQKKVYLLTDEAGGLELGSEVVVKDIKIGEISFLSLSKQGDVVLEAKLDPEVEIPVDSKFRNTKVGNTSQKRVTVFLGNSEQMLQNKDTVDMRSIVDATIDRLIDKATDKILDEISNSDEIDSLQSMIKDLFE